MTKKVTFGRVPPKSCRRVGVGRGRPRIPRPLPATAPAEPMKRLTIDIPRSLHTRIKSACALRGSKMVDEIRNMLDREYADQQTR